MLGADAVIGQPDTGVVAQFDIQQRSISGVSPDPRQELLPGSARIEVAGGRTSMSFSRRAVTGDPDDHPLELDGTTDLVFAYGADGAVRLAPHKVRGSVQVTLEAGCAVASDTDNLQRTKSLHGGMMVLGWCACVFFGIVVARYFRDRAWWVQVHIRLQSLGTAGTVSGAAFALSFGSVGLDHAHAIIGITIALLTTVQAYMGSAVHGWRSSRPIGTRNKLIDGIALTHIWLGKVLFAIALYNIHLGIITIGLADELLQPFQYLAGWTCMWLFVMEVRLWRRRRVQRLTGMMKGAHRRRLSTMFATDGIHGGASLRAPGRRAPVSTADLAEVSVQHGVPVEYVWAAHNVTHLHEKKCEYLVPMILSTSVGLRNTQEIETLCGLLAKLYPINTRCFREFPGLDPLLRDLAQTLTVIRVGMKQRNGQVLLGKARTATRITGESAGSGVAPTGLTRRVSKAIGLAMGVGDDADDVVVNDSDSDADHLGPALVSLAGTGLGIKAPIAAMPTAVGSADSRFTLCPFLVLQGRVSVALVDRFQRELCRTTYEAGQGNFVSIGLRQEVVDVSADCVALVFGFEEYKALATRHINALTRYLTAFLVYMDWDVGIFGLATP